MSTPSADTMERARAALSAALRDPRCGVAVRMTMIGETSEAFLDAIAQALHDAQEEARREQRERIRELEDGLSRAASAMEAEAVVLRSAQLAPSCVDALERKAARARALIERNSK